MRVARLFSSGGALRQQIDIARSLALEPKILVADEVSGTRNTNACGEPEYPVALGSLGDKGFCRPLSHGSSLFCQERG
ncbi:MULTISPECIES: hypothetical protein [Brenneria]|uniref:ABC transporter domain-containing protein n=1 Tax=Brenneria nigrifluens DSM 30175 = ATCC 13028 TaxID=1121120 RepID=A0ABX5V6N2_9GAMM|nr:MULTISPECIES: hypothetical protein [Brenneria]QCR06740.1 hypothetical protein EH206_22875 [Brenneria nigrifluens DSM 30175 = ATCC 13028]